MRHRKAFLLALFFLALAVKWTLFALVTEPIIFYKYPYFAAQINQGLDIGERILDLSPFYLYLTVLFQRIYGENWEVLAIFQILLGSLSVLFIFRIGEKIFGWKAGLWAALLLIFYGNLALIELTLEPEPIVLFINSLFILALMRAGERPSPKLWLLAGGLLGLSAITKPNILLIVPAAVFWIVWIHPRPRWKCPAVLFFLLGAALLLSPVALRNYLLFNDFILVTADGGKVFFHGNGPGADGMARADLPDQGFREEIMAEPDSAHMLFRTQARALTGLPLKPSECSRFWLDRALDHIRAHPFSALSREARKFLLFFGNYEVHDIDSTYKYSLSIRSWPLLPFGLLSALGLLGMALAKRGFSRPAFPLYAGLLVYFFSVLIFFAASRYRLPAAPYLALFAGHGLDRLASMLRQRRYGPFLASMAAAAGLLALAFLPLQPEIERFDRWQRATRLHYALEGESLFRKGFYREAVREYDRALALEPDFTPAYNRRGMARAILGDQAGAEQDFRQVISRAPGVDQGYLNLGLLFELRGRRPEAILLLEEALSRNPENRRARRHLDHLRSSPPGAPEEGSTAGPSP